MSKRVASGTELAMDRVPEGVWYCELEQNRMVRKTTGGVRYTRQQNPWESQLRTPELMKILLSYGTHAKVVIPELTEIANYFEKDEPDFPEELMKQKAKSIRNTILAIEATTETPELDRLR